MAVNMIGATLDLAASASGQQIQTLSESQYNPVPWDTQMLILARAFDPSGAQLHVTANLNLSVRGDQVAQFRQLPDGEYSSLYSQVLRKEIMAGQRWELTFDNSDSILVRVQTDIVFYHANPDGSWDTMPNLFV